MHLPVYAPPPAQLPHLAARWLDDALVAPVAAEPGATCDDCALAPPDGVPFVAGGAFFHPTLKCCTFVPALPNFGVGAALADGGEAQRRLEARIARGGGVTPLGVGETAREALLAREGRAGFGHARALACPYVTDGGACSIWAHRNAVCATWFCRHARGASGERLWRAAKRYLSVAERAVALHCALALDLGDEALAALLQSGVRASPLDAHELDDGQDPAHATAIWGRWRGREAEFFRACAEEAEAVDAQRLRAIGGATLAAHARALRATQQGVDGAELPERTALASLRVLSFGEGVATVEGYSPYDLVDVPAALLAVLPLFDGASVEEARALALAEHGVDVDPSLVLRLLDFGILAPA